MIWKAQLTLSFSKQFVTMPKEARPLTVQLQDNFPVIWFWVPNVDAEAFSYSVLGVMTGQSFDIPPEFWYLSTTQRQNGIVHHWFVDNKPFTFRGAQ